MGAAPPPRGLRGVRAARAWAAFGARTLAALLVRCFVLVGDTPVHAAHHLVGGRRDYDWVNYAHARHRAVRAGLARGEDPIPAIWGLREGLRMHFRRLSEARELPAG